MQKMDVIRQSMEKQMALINFPQLAISNIALRTCQFYGLQLFFIFFLQIYQLVMLMFCYQIYITLRALLIVDFSETDYDAPLHLARFAQSR